MMWYLTILIALVAIMAPTYGYPGMQAEWCDDKNLTHCVVDNFHTPCKQLCGISYYVVVYYCELQDPEYVYCKEKCCCKPCTPGQTPGGPGFCEIYKVAPGDFDELCYEPE